MRIRKNCLCASNAPSSRLSSSSTFLRTLRTDRFLHRDAHAMRMRNACLRGSVSASVLNRIRGDQASQKGENHFPLPFEFRFHPRSMDCQWEKMNNERFQLY